MTNKQVEDDAIDWLLRHFDGAVDTRRTSGAAADLEYDGRVVEVKACSGSFRGEDIWLEERQYQAAVAESRAFELWLVEYVALGEAAMRLTILAGPQLARLLERVRERKYLELPLPVAEYDSAPKFPDVTRHW